MLLEIQDVVKQFRGGVRANDGISLSVERGEVFGLLGPNGAGKTTLVNEIMALLTPTSGNILLNGIDVVANPGLARKACSFQPQGQVPIDGFTPIQAIELIGQLRGGNTTEVKRRARDLMDVLGIEPWANKPGQALSGGVRRLVGYCMAVVTPGDIVILDEPTNDVDPLRRRLFWQHIREVANSGAGVLLVTHNVLEAERAVDRLAIIDKGKVQGMGTPASLKGHGKDDMRLELILEPHSGRLEIPEFIGAMIVGRRARATVSSDSVMRALEWAREMKTQGLVEEFSISPVGLEDVYVSMVGRADALNGHTGG